MGVGGQVGRAEMGGRGAGGGHEGDRSVEMRRAVGEEGLHSHTMHII